MTFRAVILGALGAVFIACGGYYNDQVLRSTTVLSTYFPGAIFGGLIIIVLAINPLLQWIRNSWRLKKRELAVVVTFALFACNIPGNSLMAIFMPGLVMPIHYNNLRPGWRETNVLSYVPKPMLPAGGEYDPNVVDGFVSGLGAPGDPISVTDVPWYGWWSTLGVWIPLLVLMAVAVICLALVVHRQWASHERLRYPLVMFADQLIEQESGSRLPPIFRSRIFWLGLGILLSVRVINGIYAWSSGATIKIPMDFWFSPAIFQKWPFLSQFVNARWLLGPRLYPAMVGIAFLVASDIAFSIGISQILVLIAEILFVTWGISIVDEGGTVGGLFSWQRFGSYLGTAMILVYIGRRYYWDVLKTALSGRNRTEATSSAAWACRIFLLATLGVIAILYSLGLDLPFVIIVVLSTLMMFLVMSRLTAECGLYFLDPDWQPLIVLVGLFGVKALGPAAMITAGLFCMFMTVSPGTSLMPFVVNGLKLCDDSRVKVSRVSWSGIGIFTLGLIAAMLVVFWINYNSGVPRWNRWAVVGSPTLQFNETSDTIKTLDASGELEYSRSLDTWGRICAMDPDGRFLIAAGVGVALVVAFGMLRLRYSWWPLHPVIFLVWGSWPMHFVSHSFLFGWIVKMAVSRLGGARAYLGTRNLMFGIIAGDLLGGLLFALISSIYALVTGLTPVTYRIFPV